MSKDDKSLQKSGVTLPATKEKKPASLPVKVSNELVSTPFVYNQGSLDVLFCLMKKYKDGVDNYSFTIPELEELCDKTFDRRKLDRDLSALSSLSLEKEDSVSIELSGSDISLIPVFSSVILKIFDFNGYKRGRFMIKVTDSGKELLASVPEKFTQLDIREALMLPGMYSKRLYMILCQYRNMKDFCISVDKLKEMVVITPKVIEGKNRSYLENRNFFKILRYAIESINIRTKLTVSMDTGPLYTACSELKFTIEEDRQIPAELMQLICSLGAYYISEATVMTAYARGFRQKDADELVQLTIDAWKKAQLKGRKFNIPAYFVTLLRDRKFLLRSEHYAEDAEVVPGSGEDGPAQDALASGASV